MNRFNPVRAAPPLRLVGAGCGSSPIVWWCVFSYIRLYSGSRVYPRHSFSVRARTLPRSRPRYVFFFFPLPRCAPLFVSLPPSVSVVHVLTCRSPFVSLRCFAFVRPSRVFYTERKRFTCLFSVLPRAWPLFTVFPSFFFTLLSRRISRDLSRRSRTQGVREIERGRS